MRIARVLLLAAVLVAGGSIGARSSVRAGDTEARVACAFQRLNTAGKVGQIFMVSIDGSKPSQALTDLVRSWHPGGIVLFGRNIGTASDLTALIAGAQQAAALPLLVATDQEGGSVVRIRVGLTPLPAEATYGQAGSSARVYQNTLAQGLALKTLGVNLDLAPVVDVRVDAKSAIGSRSYGPNPTLDSILVTAAVLGYQAAGIGATAKHFIALGEVKANADLDLPVVKASRAEIEARDMPPMRAAVSAGVDAMMVTRVQIPALDPSGTTAYASPRMIQDIIRGELGFTGLLITDSLVTPAIFAGPGPETAATTALRAGDDMLLLGSGVKIAAARLHKVVVAVQSAVAQGSIPTARLDAAAMSVLRLKARLGLLPACGAQSRA
jgi:beta-N-acetylhexosaminidase